MQFIFHEHAGHAQIVLSGELYQHIFRVRRSVQKVFNVRNLRDDRLYCYECVQINRHDAHFQLKDSILKPMKPLYPLHMIWAMVDMKSVEKSLPILNELGVGKITFFKSAYTQHQFKTDQKRLERIIIASSQQCGRSDFLSIEEYASLHEVLQRYPKALLFDFGGKSLKDISKVVPSVIVGPEGGFSPEERECMKDLECISTAESIILRSESAAIYLQANAARFYQ